MNEYISRESILAKLKAKFCAYCPLPDCGANCKLHYLLDAVKEAPAADVVDVVRCKDCKHYKEGKLLGPTKFCYYYQIGTGLNTADDDFRSKGERRADNGKTT